MVTSAKEEKETEYGVRTLFRVGGSEEGMVEQRLSEGEQQSHLMQEHSRLWN